MGGGLLAAAAKKRVDPETVRVTFDDVAGIDEVEAEINEVVDFLKDPGSTGASARVRPRGCCSPGLPGTGKTLLARATAGEAKVPFFSASASEFIEMIVGVGASRVRELFAEARKVAPAIIFIDEIDTIGRARGGARSIGGHDEREQTLESDPHRDGRLLRRTRAWSCWPRPTGPTCSTRRCCGPAASIARSWCTRPIRRAASPS